MLDRLITRFAPPPLPGRAHDGLFSTFAPYGASAATLRSLYHQYDGAFPDEPIPPQHLQFCLLVDWLGERTQQADGLGLARMRAAYVACFERFDAFRATLRRWRSDPQFRDALVAARRAVVAELAPRAAADMARRKHLSRWRECREAPLDIEGETRLALIQRMGPDDWHEVITHWDWDDGFAEIDWITSQRTCDRATAVLGFCAARPSRFAGAAAPAHEQKLADFVATLAARLENGFYPNAELTLDLSMRQRAACEAEIAAVRAVGQSPWCLPDGLLDHAGVRPPTPRYTIRDGRVQYEYEHWLRHVAG
jgi:hypothetical protein